MCTFEDERSALVCDVAIDQVRRVADRAFGHTVCYTIVDGRGTRVQVTDNVEPALFEVHMRTAIAMAQSQNGSCSVEMPS